MFAAFLVVWLSELLEKYVTYFRLLPIPTFFGVVVVPSCALAISAHFIPPPPLRTSQERKKRAWKLRKEPPFPVTRNVVEFSFSFCPEEEEEEEERDRPPPHFHPPRIKSKVEIRQRVNLYFF